MSDMDRERILNRLRKAGLERMETLESPPPSYTLGGQEERLARLKTLMEAIRAEVHVVEADTWTDRLKDLCRKRGWKEMAYGPGSPIGSALEGAWDKDSGGLPELVPFTESMESFKDRLFGIDAGITSTLGAVADTGALILWPTAGEPRTLSLVPGVHIAVLEADKICDSLAEAMEKQGWAGKMPTNALLVSGPSKTADIEFILVFGVHGPKEMIVIIKT